MYLEKKTFLNIMEEIAPVNYAESFDNVGMLVDTGQEMYQRILFALDLGDAVIEEAISKNAQLIVTHHPIFFQPVKRLSYNQPEHKLIMKLIKNDISHFAAHTNWDNSSIGANIYLCNALNLKNHVGLEAKKEKLYKLIISVNVEYSEWINQIMMEEKIEQLYTFRSWNDKVNVEYMRFECTVSEKKSICADKKNEKT